MQLRYGILSTSSIAPRFIAAVRAAGAGEIVAVSSRSLQKAEEKGLEIADNVLIKGYLDPMELYLAACDVVISRSGALYVAETTVCGKASVMIPSPNVTGNHQYYNAKAVADRGGALLIEEKDMNSEQIIQEVLRLYNDAEYLKKMSRASKECAPVDALDLIYNTICGR